MTVTKLVIGVVNILDTNCKNSYVRKCLILEISEIVFLLFHTFD